MHPVGRVPKASQAVSLAGLGGIAGDALPIARKPFRIVSVFAREARIETRKAAPSGLRSRYSPQPLGTVTLKAYALTKYDCAPCPSC